MDDLTWTGRTLLRTVDTPPHVKDRDRNTWSGAATLPLEVHQYFTSQQGEQVSVHRKDSGRVVYTCQAPLTLVRCPVPF